MSPADNLLHTCGLVFCPGNQESLLWACDAWLLINRYSDLDWDVVYHCAKRQSLTYPLSVILGYLAEELNAPITDSFLDRLFAAASGSKLIEREVALYGARGSPKGGFGGLFQRAKTWSAQWSVLKWMIFPTSQYVRWVAPPPRPWLLPLYYVYRPLRYLSHRIVWFLRNHFKSKGFPKNLASPNPSSRPFITS